MLLDPQPSDPLDPSSLCLAVVLAQSDRCSASHSPSSWDVATPSASLRCGAAPEVEPAALRVSAIELGETVEAEPLLARFSTGQWPGTGPWIIGGAAFYRQSLCLDGLSRGAVCTPTVVPFILRVLGHCRRKQQDATSSARAAGLALRQGANNAKFQWHSVCTLPEFWTSLPQEVRPGRCFRCHWCSSCRGGLVP